MRGKEPHNWSHLFWAVSVFSLIIFCIWHLHPTYRSTWVYLLGLLPMLAISSFYKDWNKLGLFPVPERILGMIGLVFYSALIFWMVDAGSGNDFFGTLISIGGGAGWGLLQQYALNGFFVNRLARFYGSEKDSRVPFVASLLFSLAHLPNLFLMAATFFGGHASAKIFLKDRNLYILGLAHGIIAFLLYRLVPTSIHHNFVIGPRYFCN